MILNDELNVSLLNDIECVQTFISVFHFSTFKYNKSVDTNICIKLTVYCYNIDTEGNGHNSESTVI